MSKKTPDIIVRKDGWGSWNVEKGYYGVIITETTDAWVFERVRRYNPEPKGFYDQFDLIKVDRKKIDGEPYYKKYYKSMLDDKKKATTKWIWGLYKDYSEIKKKDRSVRLAKKLISYGIVKFENRIKKEIKKKNFHLRLEATEHRTYWEIKEYDWKKFSFKIMK